MSGRAVDLPRPDTTLHDTGPDTEDFARAKRQLALLEHWGFQPTSKLIEIGCGVGRLAYELAGYMDDDGRYVGFDVGESAVRWLNTNYARHLPNFQFDHFDVRNARYRPDSGVPAGQVRFPYADREFDFACSFAVFMHMQLPEIANYLSELHRVLAPGANAVLTATAITYRDHQRPELPALGNRRFVQIGDGIYAKRPDQPTVGLGFDFELLAAVIEQAGFTLTKFVEGFWHSPEELFSLAPHIGGDLFVVHREEEPVDAGEAARLEEVRRRIASLVATAPIGVALGSLTDAVREHPQSELDHQVVRLRFRMGGIRLLNQPVATAPRTAPGPGSIEHPEGVLALTAPDMDVDVVRGALADRGAVLLRGLLSIAPMASIVDRTDATFTAVDRHLADHSIPIGSWLVPFLAEEEGLGGLGRFWEVGGGRLWATEVPRIFCGVMDLFEESGLRRLLAELVGEPPVLPVTRFSVFRTRPDLDGMWWQERYVSHVDQPAIAISAYLSPSGDGAPDVELIPRLVPIQVHNHDVAITPTGVQPDVIAELTTSTPVARITVDRGDVLLTDSSVVRRDVPGQYVRGRHSVEALALGASGCPRSAVPIWW